MLSLTIPDGTTLREALMTELPKLHARAVPSERGRLSYVAVIKIRGPGGGVFTLDVTGSSMSVKEREARERDVWILSEDYVVEHLLRDLAGKHALVPEHVPDGAPVQLVSDPLMVERVKMSPGVVHVTLTGVPGMTKDVWVAMGVGPKHTKYIDELEPDLKLTVPYELFNTVAKGKLSPTDALSSPKVELRGKRMLAMQLALVSTLLAPSK